MSRTIEDYLVDSPPVGKKRVLLIWSPWHPHSALGSPVHALFQESATACIANRDFISFGRMHHGKVCCCGPYYCNEFPTILLVHEWGHVVTRLQGMREISESTLQDAIARLIDHDAGAIDAAAKTESAAADEIQNSQTCHYHRMRKNKQNRDGPPIKRRWKDATAVEDNSQKMGQVVSFLDRHSSSGYHRRQRRREINLSIKRLREQSPPRSMILPVAVTCLGALVLVGGISSSLLFRHEVIYSIGVLLMIMIIIVGNHATTRTSSSSSAEAKGKLPI